LATIPATFLICRTAGVRAAIAQALVCCTRIAVVAVACDATLDATTQRWIAGPRGYGAKIIPHIVLAAACLTAVDGTGDCIVTFEIRATIAAALGTTALGAHRTQVIRARAVSAATGGTRVIVAALGIGRTLTGNRTPRRSFADLSLRAQRVARGKLTGTQDALVDGASDRVVTLSG
jgi:hypothetical protein